MSHQNNDFFSALHQLVSFSMKICAQRKAGRRQLNLPSVPFPWSLAVHQQSVAFCARLYHVKNEAPEEEAEFFLENTAKPIFFYWRFLLQKLANELKL